MANKGITLSVNAEIYEKYKKYWNKKGVIVSKKFENFMRKVLKQGGKNGR